MMLIKRLSLLYIVFLSCVSMFATNILAINTDEICNDATFLRRATIAVTGRLPQPEKVKLFLSASQHNKRKLLVDELLETDAYVSYMCMRWGDILRVKSEFPSNLWPNGVQAYNRWIYNHISINTPYDVFVKELLLSKGSNFRVPAVNFYKAFPVRSADNFYKNINLLFLGNRHPDAEGAVFFSQLKFKSTKEWKEEIVFVDIDQEGLEKPAILPNNSSIELKTRTDWREPYVNWLTNNSNRQFAEVMVNRIYCWVMGKGLVNEPDDWRKDNPPSNPALLSKLTDKFISTGYDTKALLREILNSNYFQSATQFEPNRLLADVLVDALTDLTGISDSYKSRVPEPFTFYPEGTRSVDLGDATVSSSALELFGRSSRDVSLESQHVTQLTDRQVLYLLNSSDLEQKIRKSPRLKMLLENTKTIEQLCNELSYMALARKATDNELKLFANYAEKNKLSRRELASDILWMYVNSTEFLYQH